MKIKNKIAVFLMAMISVGTVLSPMQVSAYKANGKYYLGKYIPGDNVNTSLTLRAGSDINTSTVGIVYKTDYPGTDSDCIPILTVTSNLAGWTNSVRVRTNDGGTETRSGYLNLNYCKETYNINGLFIIPDGNNNVDNWNEEYVTLWGTGIRIYANNYTGNLNGNYKLGTDETIAVYGDGRAYGSASKGGYTGTVNLNYLLPSEFDNNNTSTVIR